MRQFLLFPLLMLLFAVSGFAPCRANNAAVWQWSAPVAGAAENDGLARAFLWIPLSCHQVRGVVFAQNNMEEEMILEHPRFRQALAALDFAEVWVSPAFSRLFRFDQGASNVFNGMMHDLAAASGYREMTFAPVVPMGHSAAASMPYYFAAWNPGRTLAVLSVSGQWPYVRNANFAPDIQGSRTIDFIPCLETMGEYESADSWASEGLQERQQHPLLPLSMAAGPAQSHFIAADAKIDYLILYIQKAAQYRLPHDWKGDAPPALLPVDPTKMGWLADRWRKDQPPTAPAAPVSQYKGDPAQAFWYFDEDMAKATDAYGAAYRGKKVDLLGFVQDGKTVPQSNSHLQVTLHFEPDADGITFHLTPTFLDTVPGESPRPAQWTGLPAGSPVGHAAGGGPISIDRIIGPFENLGPDTFRVAFQKETTGTETQFELVLAAIHPGDSAYRPAVQQAHLYITAQNAKGANQRITFPVVPNQTVGAAPVKLRAVSDAGVPVSYYVREGPAQVQGDTLTLLPVPPRAAYPMKVTVIAWQYGRAAAPLLKTAESVACAFYLTKPGGAAPAASLVALQAPAPPAPAVPIMQAAASVPAAPIVQASTQRAVSFNLCKTLTMAPTDMAGAEARAAHWNNLTTGDANTPLALSTVVDRDGKPVPGMTVTVTPGSAEWHVYDAASDAASAGANDARLFNGVFDQFGGGAAVVTVTNIPFAHYDIYFYRSDDGSKRAGQFTVGAVTLYARGGAGNPSADGKGYVRSKDAMLGSGADIDAGNFVEFENLIGSTLNATFAAVNAGDPVQRCKVVGFQIVERKQ